MKKTLVFAISLLLTFLCACAAGTPPAPKPHVPAASPAPTAAATPTQAAVPSAAKAVFTVGEVISLEDGFAYIRTEKNDDADILFAAVMGIMLNVSDFDGEWCAVTADGQSGFIRAEHLRMSAQVSPAPGHRIGVQVPASQEVGPVHTRFNNRLNVHASDGRYDVYSGSRLLGENGTIVIENGTVRNEALGVDIVIRGGMIESQTGYSAAETESCIRAADDTHLAFEDAFFEDAVIEVIDGRVMSPNGVIDIEEDYYFEEQLLTDNLVDVAQHSEGIAIDMLFAKDENLLSENVYGDAVCLLQIGTLAKLKKAQEVFAEDGYSIVIYDAYRPYSVTLALWDKYRDGTYVAGPRFGSVHNRGAAVDMSLLDADGRPVEMPSPIHTLNETSNRGYGGMTEQARDNMNYMADVMKSCGFSTISSEWWHFSDTDHKQYLRTDHDLDALLRVIYE